jgi:subtilase family serine protease
MSRARTIIAAVGATAATAGVALFGVSGSAGASTPSSTSHLAGSVAPFVKTARVTGTVAGSTKLSIQVWLKSRTSAAQQFDNAVSTPGSKSYHQYLSPNAYTARFGATGTAAAKVEKWLRSKGFTSVGADSLRSYVRGTAPASKINAAFGVQLKLYKSTKTVNAGPYALRANDRAVSVPASLASSVLGVTGLDNAGPIIPLITPSTRPQGKPTAAAAHPTACSQYTAQHKIYHLPARFGRTSFGTDNCGYSASQIRGAYGANKTNIGKGQTIALVELGLAPDMFKTLQDYATVNHIVAPSARRYEEVSIGRGTACGDDFDVEEQLDVESSYDMAPGAHQVVIGGDSCNDGDFGLQGLFDADLAVLGGGAHNRPLASVASNSWEGGIESQPASLTTIEHAYLARAAGEGVGMYFSAGDGSGVLSPSDDPDAIAVGGTSLGLSATGARLFETGWSDGGYFDITNTWELAGEDGATGGGPSLLWKQPSYQKGVVPARMARVAGDRSTSLVRSVPDISADADEDTGFAVGLIQPNEQGVETYGQFPVGGTSLASPLVAGMVTAAQQGQSRSFGLADPAFYKLYRTAALHDPLPFTSKTRSVYRGNLCRIVDCGIFLLDQVDDQSKALPGYTGQVTVKGYDNMTGVGTPNGQKFIADLRKLEK